MRDDFAIFIITHGRANNQKTLDALRNHGYTGRWYLVVDNLDEQLKDYYDIYGNARTEPDGHVIQFDKTVFVHSTDYGLSEPWVNFAVFARNAVEKLNVFPYFSVFDDDLQKFRFRSLTDNQLRSYDVRNLDEVFEAYIDYMENGDLSCVCFGVANSYIGGKVNTRLNTPDSNSLRLCFNTYIRSARHKVSWMPNMCEDRITSIRSGVVGQKWEQLLFVQCDMAPLEGIVDGGNSDVYRSLDEFTKIFFPVVVCPSCNVITTVKNKLTVRLIEDRICSKIISERYKKRSAEE